MHDHLFFIYVAGVPVLGIVAQWLAWRLRLPSILVLLACGMILGRFVRLDELLAEAVEAEGSAGLVGPRLLFPLISLAVAVILFEGGLSLHVAELKEAGRCVWRLVTIGALLSWVLTGFAAWWILGLTAPLAALLGAVLVVTGPTVVGPLLRHIRPVRRVASIAKWEGIVIDPIGAILAVVVFEEVLGAQLAHPLRGTTLLVGQTLLIGILLGGVTAVVLIQLVKRYWIPDYLHGVAFLAAALGAFALSNLLLEESGLVTVTIMGVILANQKQISIRHVVAFKEQLGVLLIACLFIVLGSRVDPWSVWKLGLPGLGFLAAMILVIRPVSVMVSTLGISLSLRERWFLAFLAPRGIVAAAVMSIFALKVALLADHTPALEPILSQANELVPITFLVIVGTVAVYGLAAAPLARRLGLADTHPQGLLFAGAEPWVREIAEAVAAEGVPVFLVDTNYGHVAAARMAGLPADCCSILSEHAREELDLGGIGRLLAMTPNDEVNALAVHEWAHIFGRANVYQLAPWDERAGRRTSVEATLRGRPLFQDGIHYDELIDRFRQGAQVKKTRLSETFTLDDFQEHYGGSAVILLVLKSDGKLQVCSAESAPEPAAGDLVIALVNEPGDSQQEVSQGQ